MTKTTSTNVQQQSQDQSQSDTQSYILALDIGTSSVRALLFDSLGTVVPNVLAQHTYALTISHEGEVSVNADMLVDLIAQCIDEVIIAAVSLEAQLKAVANDTIWHG